MDEDFQHRARWLARNILPHEALVRTRIGHLCSQDIPIEDVIQEMYARILSLPSLEVIRHPRQYAALTAKSIIVDHIRRSRVISIKSCGDLDQLGVAFSEASTEERLEFQDEIQRVVNALAQLPAACRETLILRRIEGLSQKETAQRLNVSEKMIEKHMARGARKLAELFGRGGKSKSHSSNRGSEVPVKKVDVEFGD